MVFNKEKSIQIVKPYLEELAKNYNGYVKENSPMLLEKCIMLLQMSMI